MTDTTHEPPKDKVIASQTATVGGMICPLGLQSAACTPSVRSPRRPILRGLRGVLWLLKRFKILNTPAGAVGLGIVLIAGSWGYIEWRARSAAHHVEAPSISVPAHPGRVRTVYRIDPQGAEFAALLADMYNDEIQYGNWRGCHLERYEEILRRQHAAYLDASDSTD